MSSSNIFESHGKRKSKTRLGRSRTNQVSVLDSRVHRDGNLITLGFSILEKEAGNGQCPRAKQHSPYWKTQFQRRTCSGLQSRRDAQTLVSVVPGQILLSSSILTVQADSLSPLFNDCFWTPVRPRLLGLAQLVSTLCKLLLWAYASRPM